MSGGSCQASRIGLPHDGCQRQAFKCYQIVVIGLGEGDAHLAAGLVPAVIAAAVGGAGEAGKGRTFARLSIIDAECPVIEQFLPNKRRTAHR